MAELSPMMKQYMEVKSQNKGSIVFFRLGDFYEMFFDDAVLVSKELELTLTGRDCGLEERAPMCGVPYHSCEAYIARLIKKGYKVAICEQMENPALAKGLVKREVTRIITPGTIVEGSLLDEAKNNYIASVHVVEDTLGLCFIDISTGEIEITQFSTNDLVQKLQTELGRFMPAELMLSPEAKNLGVEDFVKEKIGSTVNVVEEGAYDLSAKESRILTHFQAESLDQLNLQNRPVAVLALGVLLDYLYETQKIGLERLCRPHIYSHDQLMGLDLYTKRNLELVQTMRSGEKAGSLLYVLDHTKTAMGKRLMRSYIEQPLLNPAQIIKRQGAVAELVEQSYIRSNVMDLLDGVFDLERLLTKVVYGSANPRDLKSLSFAIGNLKPVKEQLCQLDGSSLLIELNDTIDPLEDVRDQIERAIDDDPPIVTKDGGVIRAGYDPEVDQLRDMVQHAKDYLAQMEAKEREETGIKNLRIGFNKIFGYSIEVTKSNLSQVPERYIRKQTLTNCERYITQELKELEEKLMGARESVILKEIQLFDQVRCAVADELERIQSTAHAVAQLDVLCSFAYVSQKNDYCRPSITLSRKIQVVDGRHPVVEAMLRDAPFVSNDVTLDCEDNRVAIITGPNMAGKSTYMRQVALIVLMGQIGCFVPARSAEIGVVDAIFTRVGASDDLSTGQSTFMVEMNEVAHILKNATSDSLILLDEIGRGTSTFDGMSIARSVVEYIADKRRIGAKTLFATHYHELTELEESLPGVKNYNIAAIKRKDDITFLRRIVRGGADESYGIEVAKLAGVPEPVIRRAKEILLQLEEGLPVEVKQKRKKQRFSPEEIGQMSFVSPQEQQIMDRLERVDIDSLTPIEALNILYELVKLKKI